MNLVLLEPSDFIEQNRVRMHGRRLLHIIQVHQGTEGKRLRVGLVNGMVGEGQIDRIDATALEMSIQLTDNPPQPLPIRLVLALPRPKVLNRTIAAAASMGIPEIDIINSWRVEKAYWNSPRLSEGNLRLQSVLGLEQAGTTTLPTIRLHKLFAPFVREKLAVELNGKVALLAHPEARVEAPRCVSGSVVLAIGPEGGFIDREIETFREIGFIEVSLGPRILRVETALAFLMGRLF
ncbi:MAG TPA: 16S rRNA (uracil(1498)-N(3))-methyltransferase [Terriglobia bacterium]|nr:16S rRNA (uracil(1498)-N(3))-methyltransferase [Terriglobia bacterium]